MSRNRKHCLCVAIALVGLPTWSAWGSNVPRYRLRSRPTPVDSRQDLLRRASGPGRAIPFSAARPADLPASMAGTTYYDLQHNASTGRQVDEEGGKIQVSWTKAPYPSASIRTVDWNRISVAGSPADFQLSDGSTVRFLPFGASLLINQEFEAVRPGFANLRNRPGGKAVVIYHDAPEMGGIQFNETRLDLTAGNGIFAGMPSTLPVPPGDQYSVDAPIWPKQAISLCGVDTVHHAIGTWSGYSTEVWYWRGLINDGAGAIHWDELPVLIDSKSLGISAVIEAQGDTVVIGMAKNIHPYDANADLVYYRSTDCGMSWGSLINVTQFANSDPEGLVGEVGAVFDEGGELHLIYNTSPADGQEAPVNLYHWSQSTGHRLIASAPWPARCADYDCWIWGCPTSAFPTLTEPNLAVKPAGLHSMADELLFAVWTQYGPSDSDCATVDAGGTLGGHLNGDLYISVSSDGGLTWDRPQNVSGSETPDCLPGDCLSESWISAAARADSGLYLSYVEDHHAGAAVQGQGAWTENPYMLLAVETRLPVPEPRIAVQPVQFVELHADPGSAAPVFSELTIHNAGTAALQFNVAVTPDGGGQSYVTVDGSSNHSGAIAAGASAEVVQIGFNTLGLPDPSEHHWRLEITSNDPENDPSQGGIAIDVDLQVFAASVWFACESDTLSTLTHRMQVSSCLELGAQRTTGLGFFDLVGGTDWLASGSPVVARVIGSDSVAYYSAYQDPQHRTRVANESFRALSPMYVARDTTIVGGYPTPQQPLPADLAWGTACSTDSTIGFEYRFVLPRHSDLSSGALVELSLYSRTGQPAAGVSVGAICDFDVVSSNAPDEGVNQGIVSAELGYVGVRGGSADTSGSFVPNTDIMALFYLSPGDGCHLPTEGAGQILDNAFYLHRTGKYLADTLYSLMQTFGASGSWGSVPHIDTGQAYADLSALLVYARNLTVGANDTLRWGFGIAASDVSASDLETKIARLRLAANVDSSNCCYLPGDANGSSTVGSADIIYMVNYIFKGGAAPLPCSANGNVNCDAAVTSADVIYLVNYVFKSGMAPCDICHDSPMPCAG